MTSARGHQHKTRYLLAEKKFSKLEIFEQRSTAGGVWNHAPIAEEDDFTVPRANPTVRPDQAIYPEGKPEAQFVSPVYDFLETNIPHVLMNYSDQKFPEGSSLFPSHRLVLQYLKEYAEELKPYTSFQTQVLGIRKIQSKDQRCWEVEVLDLRTKQTTKAEFDAVAVASGHYNDPFIPEIPGLPEFANAYPGSISHSKFYRRPDQYKGKVWPWASSSVAYADRFLESHRGRKLCVGDRPQRTNLISRQLTSFRL